jgi:dipeptidyl aminopeptidase/acylaminoacyl peptidase
MGAERGSPVGLAPDRRVGTADRDECSRLVAYDLTEPWPVRLVRAGASYAEPGDEGEAATSPDGRCLAYTFSPRSDLSAGRICVVDVASGEAAELTGVPDRKDHGPAWSPDSATIAYVSERSGRHQVRLVGADGKDDRALTDENADFGSLAWSPDGTLLAASRTNAGRADLVVVDVGTGEVTVLASGGTWSEPAWTADRDVIAGFESHAVPPELRRAPVGGGESVTVLAPAPAPVRRAPHVTPTEEWYPSFDSRPIPGFLFRPAAADNGPVPAVVYPHGGPTSYYGDDWDGYAQYFVAKGYAWFAINFRGSTSYGLDHERANHGEWGVTDTHDCLAAHDYLARLGWIDPNRIAIFGASYGSYLSLLSITDDPEHRYACAVAKYGDCDILTSWALGDRDGRIDLERMMGHPSQARDASRAGSPIHRIDNLQRPILIAHGERDERVNPAQSEELVAALRVRQATFEYVTYPTEGHGFLRTEPQLDFYRRLERFLDWYLM